MHTALASAGEKTFHLFPPAWLEAGLYIYPHTHPLSHFSRVPDPTTEPTAGTAAAYPAYRGPARAPAVRATLRAGDVLYLPPFWAHHAACERQCVAANVWVGSETMLRHRAVEQATAYMLGGEAYMLGACPTCRMHMCVCMCMQIMYSCMSMSMCWRLPPYTHVLRGCEPTSPGASAF